METVSCEICPIFIVFNDTVYEIFIIFAINLVVEDGITKVVEVGPDLVEPSGFWGCFHEGDFTMFGVVPGAEGFEFRKGRIRTGDHGLADIDPAGLVFAESVQGLIDHP